MRPPTQIDDSFRWDKDQLAWVQDSTGMIVTQQYIDHANIPITNKEYVSRGKPSLLQMLWADLPQDDREELTRIFDPLKEKRSELIALVNSASKVRFSQALAYLVKDPAMLPEGSITKHNLGIAPYVETTINVAYTYVYMLDYLIDGAWVLGKDLEAKYGEVW